MTEPKKIHVVRPHQTITEYAYERSSNTLDDTHDQVLIDQKDYQKTRLATYQCCSITSSQRQLADNNWKWRCDIFKWTRRLVQLM